MFAPQPQFTTDAELIHGRFGEDDVLNLRCLCLIQ